MHPPQYVHNPDEKEFVLKEIVLATTLSLALATTSAQAFDVDGMITQASPHSAAETLDRLDSALEANDVNIALR